MTVEVLHSLKRKATFIVEQVEVKKLVKEELKKHAKVAKVAGFRPGKVPANIVEQMYGGRAYEESLNKLISKTFNTLLNENNLKLIGEPKFDLISSDDDKFNFTSEFEILPEINLGSLKEQQIDKPECNLTDTDVEDTIKLLQTQKATYELIDRAAENNDQVVIDFVGKIDGVEFEGGKAQKYTLILGKGQMIPGFEDGIVGLHAGQSKDIEVTFPENYSNNNLKGKVATFSILVHEVKAQKLAEINEEFIKSIGVIDGNYASLEHEIKQNLNQITKTRLHAKIRENALKALENSTLIDAPESLIHDEIHHMMDNARSHMKKQGYPDEQIKLTHDMFIMDAKRNVILRLLVEKFIQEHKITTTDDEVRVVIADMATLYDDPEKYINWYYQNKDKLNNARAIALENKVIDKILAESIVNNTTISYKELIQE